MANRSFDDFVNRQSAEAKGAEVDWEAHLSEWKSYLTEFYDLIDRHLAKYVAEGKILLEDSEKTIHEDRLGTYSVKALTVSIGRSQIRFDPIGTIIVAAKGRVDMIGTSGTVKFVLVPKASTGPTIKVRIRAEGEDPSEEPGPMPITEWAWKIATPPPRIRYIPIEEESLFEAIMEVSNG